MVTERTANNTLDLGKYGTIPDCYKGKVPENLTPLQLLLLNGPTWTDEEYAEFLETRKFFSRWH